MIMGDYRGYTRYGDSVHVKSLKTSHPDIPESVDGKTSFASFLDSDATALFGGYDDDKTVANVIQWHLIPNIDNCRIRTTLMEDGFVASIQ